MSMEVSTIIQMLLVVFLIASAIGVSVTRNLFIAVIVFMGYSSIMAIIWVFYSRLTLPLQKRQLAQA